MSKAPQYRAFGFVRETGAILIEPISSSSHRLAVRIAQDWASENALRLMVVEHRIGEGVDDIEIVYSNKAKKAA